MDPMLGLTIVAVLLNAVLLFVAIEQNRRIRQQNASLREQNTTMFLNVADRWSSIYETRNEVLSSKLVTADDLRARFGEDYKEFLKSAEWQRMRPLLNFFEIAGYLLKRGYLQAEDLFVLVSVDAFTDFENQTRIQVPEGVLFIRLKGYIEYLRAIYKKDIYDNYDKVLLPAYKRYANSRR